MACVVRSRVHHSGDRHVRRHRIGVDEAHEVFNLVTPGFLTGEPHELGVDLHADSAGSIRLAARITIRPSPEPRSYTTSTRRHPGVSMILRTFI